MNGEANLGSLGGTGLRARVPYREFRLPALKARLALEARLAPKAGLAFKAGVTSQLTPAPPAPPAPRSGQALPA